MSRLKQQRQRERDARIERRQPQREGERRQNQEAESRHVRQASECFHRAEPEARIKSSLRIAENEERDEWRQLHIQRERLPPGRKGPQQIRRDAGQDERGQVGGAQHGDAREPGSGTRVPPMPGLRPDARRPGPRLRQRHRVHEPLTMSADRDCRP